MRKNLGGTENEVAAYEDDLNLNAVEALRIVRNNVVAMVRDEEKLEQCCDYVCVVVLFWCTTRIGSGGLYFGY
jgi:hypothetical protein